MTYKDIFSLLKTDVWYKAFIYSKEEQDLERVTLPIRKAAKWKFTVDIYISRLTKG